MNCKIHSYNYSMNVPNWIWRYNSLLQNWYKTNHKLLNVQVCLIWLAFFVLNFSKLVSNHETSCTLILVWFLHRCTLTRSKRRYNKLNPWLTINCTFVSQILPKEEKTHEKTNDAISKMEVRAAGTFFPSNTCTWVTMDNSWQS